MAWQLPQELAERVRRARRLLAESEEHAGSADLQASAGGIHFVSAQPMSRLVVPLSLCYLSCH